jgi:dienelactone hydrolase
VSRWTVGIVVLNLCLATAGRPLPAQVLVDGELSDSLWQHAVATKLAPSEEGVPTSMGGELRAVTAGGYLYLSARLPEPNARVVASSVGFDPVWEGSSEARQIAFFHLYNGAPEGEDYVRFFIRVYNENDWMLQVGPLGAYSVRWHWTGEREWYTSDPRKCDRFLVATKIGADAWNVEAAIPLDQLGSPGPGAIQLSVERNRAARPATPEEWWHWPEHQPSAPVSSLPAGAGQSDPVYRPVLLGNSDPPIEVGYRPKLPALESRWTDAAWRDVPIWALRRNEAAARLPKFPAEVRVLQDGHTLAVIARCIEPGEIVARARERDAEVERDDSFQVYLATSGSRYVLYAINPQGYVTDAFGNEGSVRLSGPRREWNSPVRGLAWRDQGAWFARLDLPLEPVAEVLGESHTPAQWRVLLMRNRPGRQGEPQEISVLPVTQSSTAYCPARYRRLKLVKSDPSELPRPEPVERSGNLASLPSEVFSPEQRAQMDLSGMLDHYLRARILEGLKSEKQAWDQVKTVEDWQRFRDPRLEALRAALGKFPPRCPLDTRVTSEFRGKGYRRENLAYQSQPGVWVTANLYLPEQHHDPMPGILILHALHNAKTQWELQDMGIMWAKAGCSVLVIDQVGYGERIETHPWDRDNINARYVEGEQLYLTGSSLLTWMVWDAMRGIDLLLEQPNVDKKELIVLGAVAGGGDPAAVTAALDPRVAAVVPFNFGESMPETSRFIPYKNEWPLDLAEPTVDGWDTTRAIRRNVVDQFLQWFICASVAPRRFVYSYELGWNVEDLPAWARYQRVYRLYDALGNLAEAHGFGPFPGPGEAEDIAPAQRRSLDPTLERWFGIPLVFADVQSSVLANLAERPSMDRRPVSELAVLTPSVASELHVRSLHEVAHTQGRGEVQSVREGLAKFRPGERREWLAKQWAEKLGNIEPSRNPQARVEWSKEIPGSKVEAIALTVEAGITVPMLLLHPLSQTHPGVVVAVAEGGKDLFLARRSEQIERLLKGGLAVCLIDVRGTGETGPTAAANTALVLGETMLGERLRDLRTVLVYLASRADVDPHRVGLWGDSFTPANPDHPILDETPLWEIGPQIEQEAEPLGGLLALLGALYEINVRAVAVQGGLASFLSLLEDSFAYIPQDVIVPGILDAGDVTDLASGLAPCPLLLQGLVDGRDRTVRAEDLESELAPVYEAYRSPSAKALSIRGGENASHFADWFLARLSGSGANSGW